MDLNASASYEFLDLSDIEENDKKRLICTLYNKNINNNQISTTQEDIKLNNLKDSGIIITSSLPLLPLPQSSQATAAAAAAITTTTTTIKKHHNNTVNGSSASSFSNNNNSKEFNNNRNSRFINESNHNNNKHVKNIATNKYPQHISSSHEKSSSSGHVIQNLMIPRFITPVALPFCAVVKPNLADIKLVPLRTPISTASAAVKPHAEQAKVFCKPFTGNILSSTTMAQHNQMLVTQQQSQQQQQQQQQQQPVPPLSQQSQQQQQQQILNTQAQVQSNQQSQQALSQSNNYPPSQFPQTHAAFNQVPPGGVYMHPHNAQPIGIYHMLPASPMPSSSVYVNNVTANVNLHGCPYIPGIGPFIPGEVQQNVSHVTEQNSGTPVQNTMNNSMPRNQRRNRGRGNGNNRRNDYNQRQQQASASPSPQEVMNSQVDPQALGGYMQYGYPYSYCGTPPQNVAHLQAQQAAGSPIYVPANSIPMFAPMQQIYGYPGLVYHPTMIPQEYSMMDEKGEEHPEGVISEMWQMRIYSEDYLGHEMVEDVNHNPSSITSSETPSMLSPSYPIYDTQMQSLELQHQMNAMHIYEAQLPQPLPVENQIQEIVVNSQPHEQILDHSSIVPVEDGNLISDQQQNLDVNEELNNSETSEGNMIKTPLETTAIYVPPPTPPQQQPEQNTLTFTTTMENQSVQQLPTNVTVAVIKQQQVVEEAPKLIERNDNITEKDLNQSVPNSTEYQQTSDINTNDKQADIEIPNVPTVNDHNAPVRSSNVKMSWTNQYKKSTASVAVTATPASNNKSSNLASKSAINTSSNQNSVSQTVQVKNYGVMKTPSSPAATNENNNNNIEKKTNQNEIGKQISTTSTASSVVPQQFQEVKTSNSQNQQFNNEAKTETQSSEPAESKVKNDAVASATNANTNTATNVNANVPQTVSQGPLSWASLFANKSSTFSTTATTQNNTPHNYPPQSKKPVAKVLPFEGTSNFVAPTTPGNMSYSAASAQGHASSQSNANNSNSMKFKPSSSSSLSGPSATSSSNLNRDSIDEWSIKFADFLTKHKIDYSPISLKPRGLTNRSNYCYINAILQALVGCPPFYNLMKAIPRQTVAMMSEKTNTPTINAMMQLISEFSHLPHGARLNRREKGQKKDDLSSELSCDPSFEPTSVYKLWNTSRSDVVEGRQEDAEEFLGYVLNKLNDEMLEIIKLVSKPKSEQNGEVNLDGDDGGEDWQMIYNNRNKGSITRQTDFGRTPISDIFRGELRSRLQREGEYSVTDVIQPFYTLQLNIEKAASVKEALEILVGRDQLEGVTCSKTNQEVAAWQQMTLEKLPVVLILHLKWFDYKMDGCTKIIKTVEFPVELRIDTKILASKKYSQKQKLYRLFAVVYHDGKEASKGHYITDVYHTGYSSWLRYDDSSVKPVSENNVLRPRTPRVPYLLYYRRCDTVPVQNAANHK